MFLVKLFCARQAHQRWHAYVGQGSPWVNGKRICHVPSITARVVEAD